MTKNKRKQTEKEGIGVHVPKKNLCEAIYRAFSPEDEEKG